MAVGISVVIPCHNEETSIGEVVRRSRAAVSGHEHEVLVVDDGSTDRTAEEAEQAGARVLQLYVNQGKGLALMAGARAAAHPVLVFLDGDGQDDPSEIPALLEAHRSGADLVIGSRFTGRLHPGAIHGLNRLANISFTRLIALLYQTSISDSQAGYRVLGRDALLGLGMTAREYDVETEMLLKALKAGWRVREVPVQRYARVGSVTDFDRMRHGLLILWTILRERVRA